jgi:hypothetical protein
VGSWPEGEEDQAIEFIKEQRASSAEKEDGDDEQGEEDGRAGKLAKLEIDEKPVTKEEIKKMVDRLAHEYAQNWWWPGKPGFEPQEEKQDKEAVTTSPHDRNLSPQETIGVIEGILKKYHVFDSERGEGENSDPHSSVESLDMASAMASALDLSVKLDEDGLKGDAVIPELENILKKIGGNLDGKGQVEYLAESRRGWKVLGGGALAKAIGIDKKKLADFTKEVVDSIEDRIQNGRRKKTVDMSVREILNMMDLNTRTGAAAKLAYYEADEEPPETLFKDPVTPEQIAETEKRLGIQLPDDYKEFLAATNGFGSCFGGILFEPPLHPCEEIRWFEDDEDYFIDLTLDIPIDLNCTGEDFEDWAKVGKAIEIGTEDIYNVWLIPPQKLSEVKAKVRSVLEGKEYSEQLKNSVRTAATEFAGSMEEWEQLGWCCVTWAAGGSANMVSYVSFKDYLSQLAVDSGRNADELLGSRKFFGYQLRKDEQE